MDLDQKQFEPSFSCVGTIGINWEFALFAIADLVRNHQVMEAVLSSTNLRFDMVNREFPVGDRLVAVKTLTFVHFVGFSQSIFRTPRSSCYACNPIKGRRSV